jgi:hypothetical protein
MSLPESMADIDVAGEGSYEGLTFAFDDDWPMKGASSFPYETDQERLEYIEDVFDGSSNTVSRWKRHLLPIVKEMDKTYLSEVQTMHD